MTIYNHTTREEFKTLIRNKIKEDGVFWSDTELDITIREALLTFGAISNFWKDKIQILTQENKITYDLFEDSIVETRNYIIPTITYGEIVNWINRDFIETISEAVPESEFLSLESILKLIEAKYNLYQQVTGLVIGELEINVIADQVIIELPNTIIDIVRVAIVEENLVEIPLDMADEEEVSRFAYSNINEKGEPKFYSTLYGATKQLRLYPIPNNLVTLKILFVQTNIGVPAYSEIIKLPDNLVPYLKFGVEADIYSNDGILYDPARATYCKQRWEEGIIVGRNYNSVLTITTNNSTKVTIDSLSNIDLYNDNIKTRRPPTVVGFAGFNIFITKDIPSSVLYNLNLTINSNAKLPETDESFIQIDLEYIDMLADYVVHLLYVKTGAAYIESTNNLKDNFLRISMNHNSRLLLQGVTFDDLIFSSKKQERDQPKIPVEQ